MKNKLNLFLLVAVAATFVFSACSKDDENPDEFDVVHVGDQWTISSVDYYIIDQSTSGQSIKNGTKTDAGFFYFDGTKGSFDITIENIHKEDVFTYAENTNDVNITSISQSVSGSAVSQNVIVLSGEKLSGTTMTLDGTITKQSLTGQFVMTATFSLVKQ